jgi:hypothetical protein
MKPRTEDCGCIIDRDRHGNESLPLAYMCPTHRDEHQARHQAAIESCSHVHRIQAEVSP